MSPESDPDPADRRGAERKRAIQKGTIVFDQGALTQPCAVLDVSATGARLRPQNIAACPDRFQLRDHKSTVRDCVVVWREGSMLGVKFE